MAMPHHSIMSNKPFGPSFSALVTSVRFLLAYVQYLPVPDIDGVDFWQWDSTLEYRLPGQSSRGAHWFYSSTSNGVRRFVHMRQRQKTLTPPLSRRRTSEVHRYLRVEEAVSYLGLGCRCGLLSMY